MRKSRAALAPFWSLKSNADSLHVFFLAYVMPWIHKASLALYSTHHCEGAGPRDLPEVRKVYCTVEFVFVIEASKLVAIKVEGQS